MESISFFVFQKHTLFIPLRNVYGECFSLISNHTKLFPMHCLVNDVCPVNVGCMDVLAKRINFLFTSVVPTAKQAIIYFKYQDKPNSIRAVVINRDLDEPKLMILNPYAFKKFQKESVVFEWVPPTDYLLIQPSTNIVPVQSLLTKKL